MLTLWMLYAMMVGVAVAGAAALLEERPALAGKGRWVWMVALLAGLAIPLFRPSLIPRPAPAIDIGAAVVPLAGVRVGPGAAQSFDLLAFLTRWDGPLAGAWAGATLVLLGLLIGGAVRLRRRRRDWRRDELLGTPVLVSEALGPAVVGLMRPEIVVPEWVLELDPAEQALILEHEEEHRRRRDPALLTLGAVAPIVMPWSPALWWSFARLRHAVEADCDQRVLASGLGTPTRYARLLVDVGARALGIVPVGAGFGETSSSLERRVRALLNSRVVGGVRGALVRGAAAVVLIFVACLADSPTSPTVPGPTTSDAASLADAPTFTPYTVGPSILNKTEVVKAMEKAYPPLLRDAGVGGTVIVYFFVGADGTVQNTKIFKSSGRPALDAAALSVSKVYRFSPALNRDEKVPAWIQFPITFQASKGTVTQLSGAKITASSAPQGATRQPVAAAPTFTPYTVGPSILNKNEVIQAMEKAYPPLLRDAGIGGTAIVYFFVDADGTLRDTRLFKSSGHPALDSAALSVAKTYRFSPARNRDQKVGVWVQFPITFAVQ